ncbi:rhomboid family intramembrane serine protease [Gardnerella pickettii]|uniref:rhomboid family intramembrane serine protease n=1 Tax=Gardnerella pickettii TaxID=2914924 RepID=UPI0039EFDB71
MNNFDINTIVKRFKANCKTATYSIIYICVFVWIIEIILHTFLPSAYQLFVENTAFAPFLITKASWTWFTSMFVHAPELTHILFNMICLYSLGVELERFFGKWKFFFLYAISGFGGCVATLLYSKLTQDWVIAAYGASGAIMGLIGALLVAQWRLGESVNGTLIWIGLTLAMPLLVPNIAWQAHIGGIVTGIVLSTLLGTNNPLLKKASFNERFAVYSLLTLIVLLAISAFCLQ